ncbi:MAG: alcohol dehydrogenase catalytic domain-containing protein [Planctomycetes bacterium]|nr:alcohol dehydrogenase catalytic domain-containing protein [Planctomycetota bacterium]
MRAVTFRSVRDVVTTSVADPRLETPFDAIVQVELAAICGSDLHPYLGREVGLDVGTVLGHEFLGTVVAVGSGVAKFRVGDRVVSPFSTSCGSCWFCARGLTARCTAGQLFGWVQQGRGLHGGQAERVRVPLADSTLVAAPTGVPAEAALLAGDVLSTGFFGAQLGGVQPGDVVVVVGAGPVGICALLAAQHAGAQAVFALDLLPERLALARRHGAIAGAAEDPELRASLREATHGRGADVVLECVGSAGATRVAFELVRLGGTIAAAGVHCEPQFAFSPGEAYDKNLTYRAGRCSARALMDTTLPLLAQERFQLGALFSHRLALDEARRGYELFERRLDGCTKVLLVP